MVMNPTKGTLPLFAHNNQYVTRSYGVCVKTAVHLDYTIEPQSLLVGSIYAQQRK